MISAFIHGKHRAGFSNSQESYYKESSLLMSDAITNYKTVASFGHEYLLTDILHEKLLIPCKKGMIQSHVSGILYGYSNFSQNALSGILFFLGAVYIRWEDADPEEVFLAIFVLIFASWGAGQAQQFAPSQGKAYKSALRIFSIIDEKSEIDVEHEDPNHIIADENTFNGNIEFKNIWFRYPTRPDSWILKDLNLTINPKEQVALVGESGSGKSTIVQLLLRFYEPHFGQILINGVDIKDYNVQSLRRQMGLVQQMPTLFNESVRFNICYGEETENEKNAIEAAKISNATGFIAKLRDSSSGNEDQVAIEEHEEEDENKVNIQDVKDGLQTSCGTNGGKLSGGQKQRVAIARAIVRQPQLLLLDEATSALDEVSQGKVQAALEKVMKGRTSIVIAHRLTTIENADRIVILKNGKVEKEGKFNDIKEEL